MSETYPDDEQPTSSGTEAAKKYRQATVDQFFAALDEANNAQALEEHMEQYQKGIARRFGSILDEYEDAQTLDGQISALTENGKNVLVESDNEDVSVSEVEPSSEELLQDPGLSPEELILGALERTIVEKREIEERQEQLVAMAREIGLSWNKIGVAVDISAQSARNRWNPEANAYVKAKSKQQYERIKEALEDE